MSRSLGHFGACGHCPLFALVAPHPALAQDKRVEEATTSWNTYFNKGGAHGLAALYDEKAIVWPGIGKTIQGREEIEKLLKSTSMLRS